MDPALQGQAPPQDTASAFPADVSEGSEEGQLTCIHTALPNGPTAGCRGRDQPERTPRHSSIPSRKLAPSFISLIHSFTHFFIPSFDKYFLRANLPPGTVLGGPPGLRLHP